VRRVSGTAERRNRRRRSWHLAALSIRYLGFLTKLHHEHGAAAAPWAARTVTPSLLAPANVERTVAVRVPYFESALRIVAETDYIATIPAALGNPACSGTGSRRRPALVYLEPPVAIPRFVLQAVWHCRHDDDPLQRWLRDLLESILDK